MRNRIRDVHRIVTAEPVQAEPKKKKIDIKHGIVSTCNGEKN